MPDTGTARTRVVVATRFPLPAEALAGLSDAFEVLREPVDASRAGAVRALLTHSGLGATPC